MLPDPSPGPPAWFEFNGQRYYRNARVRYYYDPTGNLLHHAVWAAEHGPIPAGHHVHHRNHDRGDNAESNLQLLTDTEHWELHAAERRLPAVPPRPCVECGKEFQPLAAKAHVLCCSRACGSKKAVRTRAERSKPREERELVCKQCLSTFRTTATHAVCCSDECRTARRKARNTGDPRYDPGRYGQPRIKTCPVCGQEFEAKTDHIELCSRKCRAKRSSDWNTARWRERAPVARRCEHCGDEFFSRATAGSWCSKLCRTRARRTRSRAKLGL